MIYSPTAEQIAPYDQSYSVANVEHQAFTSPGMSSFAWPIKTFSVGSTIYVFLRPIQRYDSPCKNGWVSYIRELPQCSGKGLTSEEAFEDLKINIHADFQQLHRKRPFEMNKEESAKWSNIASVIDILEYKMTTPVIMREIGQVSHGKIARPYRIKWITGENYLIAPEKAPGDLMACRPGEWIEAVVKRNPVSNQIFEIESINRLRFRIPTDTEINKFWGNIQSANLPRSDWSW